MKWDPLIKSFLISFLLAYLSIILSCTREQPTSLIPEDYGTWSRTTQVELNYPVPGHEDNYRIIFINPVGKSWEESNIDGIRQVRFPEGTILVKEVYAGSGQPGGASPVMLTAMVKAPSDSRALGGWIWVVKDIPQGKETVMTNNYCFVCHANANERHPYGDKNPSEEFRDYLFFLPQSD